MIPGHPGSRRRRHRRRPRRIPVVAGAIALMALVAGLALTVYPGLDETPVSQFQRNRDHGSDQSASRWHRHWSTPSATPRKSPSVAAAAPSPRVSIPRQSPAPGADVIVAPEPSGGGGAVPAGGRWIPRPGTAWQWQLTGKLDPSLDVPVYDVDGFSTTAAQVAQLHAAGKKVICYIDVGSAENFRPDYSAFTTTLLGDGNGWAGERWLDIRRIDQLAPVMEARFDMCRSKGFDAVEADNVDAAYQDTGFPITPADQLRFNRYLADLAHARGMSIGLKNDLEQVPQLVTSYDFAVNEQCFEYDECERLTPFITAGKAVFNAEYAGSTGSFCSEARSRKLSAMLKRLELDAWRQGC